MRVTKKQLRREKMALWNAQVEAEKTRLLGLGLPVKELIDRFHCGNFFTELAAAQIVYAREKHEVMEEVLAGLRHPSWKVRRTCADFMDHWGDGRCVEPLIRALRDPKEHVRRLALHSLTCQQCKECPLEGDFVPPLVERALTDRSRRVRRIATGTLGNFLYDERAVDALRHLAVHAEDAVVVARARGALDRLLAS